MHLNLVSIQSSLIDTYKVMKQFQAWLIYSSAIFVSITITRSEQMAQILTQVQGRAQDLYRGFIKLKIIPNSS